MNSGAGPTRARIAPDPTNSPVPIAPPRALHGELADDRAHAHNWSVQKLNVSTLQSTVGVSSSSSSLGDCRMAVYKGLFVHSGLFVVSILRTVSLLGVDAVRDDLVIRHVDVL
jgi:hypothetical protein